MLFIQIRKTGEKGTDSGRDLVLDGVEVAPECLREDVECFIRYTETQFSDEMRRELLRFQLLQRLSLEGCIKYKEEMRQSIRQPST